MKQIFDEIYIEITFRLFVDEFRRSIFKSVVCSNNLHAIGLRAKVDRVNDDNFDFVLLRF